MPPAPGMFAFLFAERASRPEAPASISIESMTLALVGKTKRWRSHLADARVVRRYGNLIDIWGRIVPDPTIPDPARRSPDGAPAYYDASFRDIEVRGDPFPSGQMSDITALNGLQAVAWFPWEVYKVNGFDVVEFGLTRPVHPSRGTVRMTGCTSENVFFAFTPAFFESSRIELRDIEAAHGFAAVLPSGLTGCTLDIAGVRARNFMEAVFMDGFRGTRATVSGLDTTDASGVFVHEPHSASPSTYELTRNRIRMTDAGDHAFWAGFELHSGPSGEPGEQSPRVIVQQNSITSPGHEDVWGPIYADGLHDMQVAENGIEGASGAGFGAIYVFSGERCRLINNDTRRFASSLADLLLIECRDTLVVGGAAVGGAPGEDVFDFLGEDNRVVGARADKRQALAGIRAGP